MEILIRPDYTVIVADNGEGERHLPSAILVIVEDYEGNEREVSIDELANVYAARHSPFES